MSLDLVKNQSLKYIISSHWIGSLLISFHVFLQNRSWSASPPPDSLKNNNDGGSLFLFIYSFIFDWA